MNMESKIDNGCKKEKYINVLDNKNISFDSFVNKSDKTSINKQEVI
jgi:hypothetical protein